MLRNYLKPVYAHCDLPCGIYETNTMTHAAATCAKMVEKILSYGELDSLEKNNNFVRAIQIKEEHAQKVKDQLYILWSDYFKPEHLEKFPDLHTTFWQTIKQASSVKQHVSEEECQKLSTMVGTIVTMFEDSKK
jgi:nickel superoxide dismutase